MDDRETCPRPKGGILFYAGGALTVALAVAVLAMLLLSQESRLRAETESRMAALKAGPPVTVASVTRAPEMRSVELLGEARPYASVTLYAKLCGYLKEIKVDKGDKVSSGQLLATIESPELDRQYEGAVADARNKREIARRTWNVMPRGGASKEDAESAEAAALVAEAHAASLQAQLTYKTLRAPFAGTITARFADPGALVQDATSSQTTTLPLVTLCQVDRLRIYVYPDQRNASLVRPGDKAEIWDAARPDVRLPATVTRTCGELDVKTRTMLTEIDLDNRQGAILPGSFVRASLSLKMPACLEIPAEGLVMHDGKSCAAVLTDDNRVSYRPVVVYDTDGQKVLLRSGLNEGERVVLNMGDSITEGGHVQPLSEGRP